MTMKINDTMMDITTKDIFATRLLNSCIYSDTIDTRIKDLIDKCTKISLLDDETFIVFSKIGENDD